MLGAWLEQTGRKGVNTGHPQEDGKMGDWFCEGQVQMVTGSHGRGGGEQCYHVGICSSSPLRERSLSWALVHQRSAAT